MSELVFTLLTKPGCHLCDDARNELERVLERPEVRALNIQTRIEEVNVLEDAELLAKHAEEIPVLLIDGKMHSYWHIDPDRLIRSLQER